MALLFLHFKVLCLYKKKKSKIPFPKVPLLEKKKSKCFDLIRHYFGNIQFVNQPTNHENWNKLTLDFQRYIAMPIFNVLPGTAYLSIKNLPII